jgi:hypothetical protein
MSLDSLRKRLASAGLIVAGLFYAEQFQLPTETVFGRRLVVSPDSENVQLSESSQEPDDANLVRDINTLIEGLQTQLGNLQFDCKQAQGTRGILERQATQQRNQVDTEAAKLSARAMKNSNRQFALEKSLGELNTA